MSTETTPPKFPLESMDVADGKRQQLKQLFPEVVTEARDPSTGELKHAVDWEKLKASLGDVLEREGERFGLSWPGKSALLKVIQQPSVGTLKPCREESVKFDETENLFIEGDNLEVLKLLQKSYFGKVKMIYIDPPYNTGNEFVYPDNFTESLETYLQYTGMVDAQGRKFSTNAATEGRFHSKWLNMMYPRLFLARNLLKQDGAFFVSIGQDELSNLIDLCNEIFGEENQVTICSRVIKTGGQKGTHFSPCVDYVLVYAKSIDDLAPFRAEISENVIQKVYTKVASDGPRVGEKYRSMGIYQAGLDSMRGCRNQRYYIEAPDGELIIPPGNVFPKEESEGSQIAPVTGFDGVWRWTYSKYISEKEKENIEFIESQNTSLVNSSGDKAKWNVYYKIWLNDRMEEGQLPGNIFNKFESRHSSAELKKLKIPFDFAKPSSLIAYLASICGLSNSDICLDFFAGSCTTAQGIAEYALEKKIRSHFICVQLPEPTPEGSEEKKDGYDTISNLGKERIRRVIKKIEAEQGGQLDLDAGAKKQDLGFKVFKLSESNFKLWEGNEDDPEKLKEQLEMHINHLDPSSTPEDILYELLLKAGFPLTTKVEKISISDKSAYSIAEGALIICLDDDLTKEAIQSIAALKPVQCICLDAAFHENDQLKTNAVQTMEAAKVQFRTV